MKVFLTVHGIVLFLYLLLYLEVEMHPESQLIFICPTFSWAGAWYGWSCLRHRVALEKRDRKPVYHLGFRKSFGKTWLMIVNSFLKCFVCYA